MKLKVIMKRISVVMVFIIAFAFGIVLDNYSNNEFTISTATEVSGIAVTDAPQSGGGNMVIDGRININTADKEILMQLDGIGDSKAQSIIDYRTANGDFSVIEEMVNVRGIGPKTLEKLRDKICVK